MSRSHFRCTPTFTRKAGEEITDQLYHFELHGRRYALRGEFTPSLARAGAFPALCVFKRVK